MEHPRLDKPTPDAAELVEPNLKQQTVAGVIWSAGARIVYQALQFVVTVVLARLLVPEDFGLIAMIAVFTGFASIFVDFGLAAAIIQRKEVEERHLSSAFWLNVAAGIALTAIVAALAPALSALYGESRLLPLILVMAASFALGSIGIVQKALLTRAMNFRRLGAIEVTAALVGGGTAITAALMGFGVWSLVIQLFVAAGIRLVLLWSLSDWRPHLILEREAVQELWRFSRNLAGFSAVNYWSRNADNFLIGKFVGASGLGIYSRAYSLMLMPLEQISAVTARVMFPALSRIQEDRPRVKRAYLRAVGIIGLLSFPVTAGLLVVAEPFVLTLYGAKWREVVPVLQILCIAGLIQPVSATVGWIYTSQGRTDWLFRWGLVSSGTTLLAFGIGIMWGVHGVAVAYAIRTYVLLYPNFAIPGRLIEMRIREIFHAVRGPLFSALAMAGLVWAAGTMLPEAWSPGAVLLAQFGVGVLAYGALVHLFVLKPYLELKDLVRERVRGRTTVTLPA
ncbi:MAG: MOP flippase family protein [Dehalococcoidia bacterium]